MKIVKKKDIETHFNIYALQFIAVSTPLEVKKKIFHALSHFVFKADYRSTCNL